MKYIPLILILLLVSGCGTNAVNEKNYEVWKKQIEIYKEVATAEANACTTAAGGCAPGTAGDLCRVATVAICRSGAAARSQMPAAPQFRSRAQDIALIWGQANNTVGTLVQGAITGLSIHENGRNTRFISRQQTEQLVGITQAQQNTFSSLGGQLVNTLGTGIQSYGDLINNLPPSTQIGDGFTFVGNDQTIVDNGSQIGDSRRDTLSDDSFIGDDNRIDSAGPIQDSGNVTNPDDAPPIFLPGPGGG